MPGVKVCQLLHTLHVGGAEVLAARLARRLREQHDFVFVCLDEIGPLGEELRAEGFTVEVLHRKAGLDLRCAWRLASTLRRHRVQLVQAHQYTPFSYAQLARLVYPSAPILFTEHGRHQPDYPRRKRMLFNRWMLRRCDHVVAVGEAVKQALIVNEGLPTGRIEIVYNGIDTDRFTPSPTERESVRNELGLADDDLAIIQVARLDYLKDHLTAVRTMSRVVQVVPRARLFLVGEGPEQAKIEAELARLGAQPHVTFLGLRNDIPRLLRGADLFLLTSTSEGIPLTLIEAMATSLPIVSTHVGGTGEVVLEGKTGFLAPSGDDTALSLAIVQLAQDSALRQQLGRAGREVAVALFSEAQMAQRYAELYSEMLHGRRR
jgi:glycosyltransferase involved in cell wall biosynthesis